MSIKRLKSSQQLNLERRTSLFYAGIATAVLTATIYCLATFLLPMYDACNNPNVQRAQYWGNEVKVSGQMFNFDGKAPANIGDTVYIRADDVLDGVISQAERFSNCSRLYP